MSDQTSTKPSSKGSRVFGIASLSFGVLSFASFGAVGPLVYVVAALSAILGIVFGTVQLIRHRSARVLACAGMLLSFVAIGAMAHSFYAILFRPPTYADQLTRMGYKRSVIDNPLSVELFRAVQQPSAQWIYSGVWFSLGWYSDNQDEDIPLKAPAVGNRSEPVSFDPKDPRFGFFIKMDDFGVRYRWHTESARNKGVMMGSQWVSDVGTSHVKIFPTIVDGREIPNSYLLCWEDYPLSGDTSAFIDFTDLIVRVDGITPVTANGSK